MSEPRTTLTARQVYDWIGERLDRVGDWPVHIMDMEDAHHHTGDEEGPLDRFDGEDTETFDDWAKGTTNVESGSVSVNETGDPLTVETIAADIHQRYGLGSLAPRPFRLAVESVAGPLLSRLNDAETALAIKDNHDHFDCAAAMTEKDIRIAELEQWKREATEVLAEWDAIYDSVAEESSDWGRTRASVVAQRLVESERQCWEMATRAGDRDRRIAELEAEQPEWHDGVMWEPVPGERTIATTACEPSVARQSWEPVQVAIRPRPDNA